MLSIPEVVWGNRYVNASIGSQHRTNAAILEAAARKAQQQGLGDCYLNIEVILCDNPTLATQIRQGLVTITPTLRKTLPTSPYTTLTTETLTQEILGRAPPPTPPTPQPSTQQHPRTKNPTIPHPKHPYTKPRQRFPPRSKTPNPEGPEL